MVGQSLHGVAAACGDDEKVDGRGIELGEEDTHNDGGDDESDDDDLVGGGGDGQDICRVLARTGSANAALS